MSNRQTGGMEVVRINDPAERYPRQQNWISAVVEGVSQSPFFGGVTVHELDDDSVELACLVKVDVRQETVTRWVRSHFAWDSRHPDDAVRIKSGVLEEAARSIYDGERAAWIVAVIESLEGFGIAAVAMDDEVAGALVRLYVSDDSPPRGYRVSGEVTEAVVQWLWEASTPEGAAADVMRLFRGDKLMESDYIDVTGIDRAELLAALYNEAPGVPGRNRGLEMTKEKAQKIIDNDGGRFHFDYLNERPIKVSIEGDRLLFSERYDREAIVSASTIVERLRK